MTYEKVIYKVYEITKRFVLATGMSFTSAPTFESTKTKTTLLGGFVFAKKRTNGA